VDPFNKRGIHFLPLFLPGRRVVSTPGQVLIALPDGSWIALEREAFDAALAAGAEAMRKRPGEGDAGVRSDAQWLTADEISQRTSIDASWFLARARLNEIPHIRAGKYVRFDINAVTPYLESHPRDTRTGNTRPSSNALNGRAK
jgi:hypothetical protein